MRIRRTRSTGHLDVPDVDSTSRRCSPNVGSTVRRHVISHCFQLLDKEVATCMFQCLLESDPRLTLLATATGLGDIDIDIVKVSQVVGNNCGTWSNQTWSTMAMGHVADRVPAHAECAGGQECRWSSSCMCEQLLPITTCKPFANRCNHTEQPRIRQLHHTINDTFTAGSTYPCRNAVPVL